MHNTYIAGQSDQCISSLSIFKNSCWCFLLFCNFFFKAIWFLWQLRISAVLQKQTENTIKWHEKNKLNIIQSKTKCSDWRDKFFFPLCPHHVITNPLPATIFITHSWIQQVNAGPPRALWETQFQRQLISNTGTKDSPTVTHCVSSFKSSFTKRPES